MSTPYKSPTTQSMVQLDPHHTGRTVRIAFLIESLLNLFTIPLITHPRTILPFLLLDPPGQMTNATVLFARLFGGLVVGGLTTALWLGIPNHKTAIDSRRTVYLLLGAGEVLLIPILVIEGWKGGRVSSGAALSVRACVGAVGCLLPPLLWRVYVLGFHPEMLGRYKEIEGKKGE